MQLTIDQLIELRICLSQGVKDYERAIARGSDSGIIVNALEQRRELLELLSYGKAIQVQTYAEMAYSK
ncbi:hypothetical protein ACTMTF_15225 [Nonomuraea sp. ZG12]|uniref:hypothetical protein n=1 Tax=Nonomuraea sp. ZG12 TaxID=3452207 RepID=UPI003F89815F